MPKIIDLLPHLMGVRGLVGVEIEVEGERLPNGANCLDLFNYYWRVTQDGSLRGAESWEYVFRKPLSLTDCKKALDSLENEYVRHLSTVDDTVRAGIHVHVNVQDLTLDQLVIFFTLYYALEEVLILYCGEGRAGNHFCLRASDAEYILYSLLNSFEEGRVGELVTDNVRYAAMNVNALFKYGSIEFRTLRSTRDMDRIFNWVKVLVRLKEMSKEYEHPREVLESMSFNGGEEFAKAVLGEELFPLFKCPNISDLVFIGARNVQDFAYLVDVSKLQFLHINEAHLRGIGGEGLNYMRPFLGAGEAPIPEGEGEVPANPQRPLHEPPRGLNGRFVKRPKHNFAWGLQPIAKVDWMDEVVEAAPIEEEDEEEEG